MAVSTRRDTKNTKKFRSFLWDKHPNKRLSDNPSGVRICHSEPFSKFRTGSAKKVIVILSGAKDLEILRLTPQNDVIGQPLISCI